MFQAWRNLYSKSDNAKAYSLLSPALFLIILVMLIPMALMLSFSSFTQVSMMEIDFTPTFQRYIDFFEKSLLVSLLIKSVKISFIVTLITLLTAVRRVISVTMNDILTDLMRSETSKLFSKKSMYR